MTTTRAELHEPTRLGERVAESVTRFSGTFKFLGLHLLWWGPWILFRVEPFPYGLLTMILSLEAIVLTTLVMISQNRQSQKDRAMAAKDDEEISLLLAIQTEQLEILKRLDVAKAPA